MAAPRDPNKPRRSSPKNAKAAGPLIASRSRPPVWYLNYPAHRAELGERMAAFEKRCLALGRGPGRVLESFRSDLVARAVQESNWQEGIYLDLAQTKVIVDLAAHWTPELQMPESDGPAIDLVALVATHAGDVRRLKKGKASIESVATFNLTRAHIALDWIGAELLERNFASVAAALEEVSKSMPTPVPDVLKETKVALATAQRLVDQQKNDQTPLETSYTGSVRTSGERLVEWIKVPGSLIHPMRVQYLHCLHSIAMMGQLPKPELGKFRTVNVRVDHGDVMFTPKEFVKEFMAAYCHDFPRLYSSSDNYDPVLEAAKASHRFVAIHPYTDGNGRMSRLIMNLLLSRHFHFVSLKADKIGRKRYRQALRRADRGHYDGLCSLIATSLSASYERLTAAMDRGITGR